jgi:effector-binding domain-containing protein
MRIFKKILIILLSIILLFLIAGLFLPSKSVVKRQISINRSVDIPFMLINDLTKWKLWSPWYAMDTLVTLTYSEPAEGTSAYYNWDSKNRNVGKGKVLITESKPFEHILIDLMFADWGTSKVEFLFENTSDSNCNVEWSMTSEHGWNIPSRWFGLMMDNMVGADFESGLSKIAEISESMPERLVIGGYDAELIDVLPMKVIGIRYQLPQQKITSDIFAKSFAKLNAKLISANLELIGMPMALYYSLDPKKLDFEAAIPVAGMIESDKQIVSHELPQTKALILTYKGAYDKMGPAYEAAYNYLSSNGLVMNTNSPIREIYITDPELEKDTAMWMTEIVFPLEQ